MVKASIIKLIILLAFLLVNFQSVVFAGEIIQSPNILPNSTTHPGMNVTTFACREVREVLFEQKVYKCTSVFSQFDVRPPQSAPVSQAGLNQACWNTFMSPSNYNNGQGPDLLSQNRIPIEQSGLTLSRTIESFFNTDINTLADFAHPCIVKSSTPDPAQPTCNIDAVGLIKSAFANKFPLDIIGSSPFQSQQASAQSSSSCPVIQIGDQSFQACYLLDLVKGLKYPLLLIFVFGALTRF
ncbi:MAG TPA: hypothetical protein VK211_23770 [Kamptonema sp.]|nr:hypothetical protein [Kamptonema sp.]